MSEIIEFIKEHWKAYLVAAILAIALGLLAAYGIMLVGSTPS